MAKNILKICDCGVAEYREILKLQQLLRQQRYEGLIPDTVLITEHLPVITLGARKSANKMAATRQQLEKMNIDVVEIRRGGGVTAHNPGQLVFYPVLNIQKLKLGINKYIRELEQIGIELLDKLNVIAERKKGFPGLWTNSKKIASIGVRVSKAITIHGIAINIQNDLSIFEHFVPCGLDGVEITSVKKETGQTNSMAEVKQNLSKLLIEHFSSEGVVEYVSHCHFEQARRVEKSKISPLQTPMESSGRNDNKSMTATSSLPVEMTVKSAMPSMKHVRKLPLWLKRPMPAGAAFINTNNILASQKIQTICVNANCPNRGECWNRGTATVLILGNICTRNCKFCSVPKGKPEPPDPTEPGRVANMAKEMKLKYLVITSVDRDDLDDGGAGHFRDCINKARELCSEMKFEILTPDFKNCQQQAIDILSDALPFVFAHNIETVPALYKTARAGGDYKKSLNLLKMAKEKYTNISVKSSIMLGLGETDEQVEQTLNDLLNVGCERITIGQYLKPSKNSLDVVEYVTPEKFNLWKQRARQLGFTWVMSSPFTRSSYFAEQQSTPN